MEVEVEMEVESVEDKGSVYKGGAATGNKKWANIRYYYSTWIYIQDWIHSPFLSLSPPESSLNATIHTQQVTMTTAAKQASKQRLPLYYFLLLHGSTLERSKVGSRTRRLLLQVTATVAVRTRDNSNILFLTRFPISYTKLFVYTCARCFSS